MSKIIIFALLCFASLFYFCVCISLATIHPAASFTPQLYSLFCSTMKQYLAKLSFSPDNREMFSLYSAFRICPYISGANAPPLYVNKGLLACTSDATD